MSGLITRQDDARPDVGRIERGAIGGMVYAPLTVEQLCRWIRHVEAERDAALAREAQAKCVGTGKCPICGDASPHKHDEIRKVAHSLVCQISDCGMAYAIDVLVRGLELLLKEKGLALQAELAEVREREKRLRGALSPFLKWAEKVAISPITDGCPLGINPQGPRNIPTLGDLRKLAALANENTHK